MAGSYSRGITKVALVSIVVFITAEITARFLFNSPYSSLKARPFVPYYQSDSALGWKNNPGKYEIDFSDNEESRTIAVQIGERAERLSFPNSLLTEQIDFLFVGDSWTFGEAVLGNEAFPGRIAKALPDKEVVNFGVGGYSTYQSLLQLEALDWTRFKPKQVFYGFLSFHEERNIASNGWVRSLSQSSQGRRALLPYVKIDKQGELIRRSPISVSFPKELCNVSKFFCLMLHSYWRASDAGFASNKYRVTQRLIEEMAVLVGGHRALFTVILLNPDSFRYESYLKEKGIDYLRLEGKINRLSYDAHPDLAFHSAAAQRILEKVTARVQN